MVDCSPYVPGTSSVGRDMLGRAKVPRGVLARSRFLRVAYRGWGIKTGTSIIRGTKVKEIAL